MKLKEIIPIWFDQKEMFVKKSSISAYYALVQNHIIPEFGENEIIEEHQVQGFVLDKIKSGLSQKTIKDVLIVLKMILKYASKHKMMEYVIWDVQYPAVHDFHSMDVLSIKDHKFIIEKVKDSFTFRKLGILIALSTGMRIGEICALTWEDFDLEKNVITIRKTIQRIYETDRKTGLGKTVVIIDAPKTKSSNREIPLSKDLIAIIKPLYKIVNPSYYVLTNEEKPTEPRTYRSFYKNYMEELGMPYLKFHGLRHTFATRCINAKIDIKTVSVILGHSNISTTLNTYVHPNLEQKKSAINDMFKSMK